MNSRLRILFAILICATVNTFAQSPETLARLMPYLGNCLSKVLGDKADFSTDVTIRLFESSSPVPMTVALRLSSNGRKMRWDLETSQLEPAPLEGKARLKQLGLDQMVFISRLDKNMNYVLFPKAGSYLQTQIPASVVLEADSKIQDAVMTRMPLGEEAVDGKPCTKFRVVAAKDKEPQEEAILWYVKGSEAFPLKIQLIGANSSLTMRFSNVKLAKPDSTLFEVPSGFVAHTNFQQTIEFASQRMKEKAKVNPE